MSTINAENRTDGVHGMDRTDSHAHAERETLFGTVKTKSEQQNTVMTASLVILAVLASCTILYLASRLLVPVVVACLAYLTLRPFVCKLCQRGLSQGIASGIVIVVLMGITAAIIGVSYQPSERWISAAPASAAKFRDNIDAWREPLTAIDDAEKKLSNASSEASAEPRAVEVSVQKPGLVSEMVLINSTGRMLVFFGAIAVLTFFLLSTGDDLINRTLHVLPNDEKRHVMLEMISGIQDSVGRYFGQITMINIGLGVVVTGMMWLVGMPTPLLWGVVAMRFNFVPYVGATRSLRSV